MAGLHGNKHNLFLFFYETKTRSRGVVIPGFSLKARVRASIVAKA